VPILPEPFFISLLLNEVVLMNEVNIVGWLVGIETWLVDWKEVEVGE
jgi:hypothetical protein